MVTLPTMYTFRRCPYAMRARLAVDRVGCQVDWREIALSNKPAAMLAVSPKGTVPVWIGTDGQVIEESLAIMLHLFNGLADPALNPQGALRDQAHALIDQNDTAFKHHLDRYKYHSRYPGVDPVSHQAALAHILADWNDKLSQHDHLSGTQQGLADLAILPFVRQCRIADPDWFDAQPWAALHRWLQAFLQSAPFERVMVKRPLWQP